MAATSRHVVRLQSTNRAADQRISVTDPRGYRWSTVYDPARRLIRRVDPLSRRTTFGYDPADQNTSRVDGRGVRTTYAFDAAGRDVGRAYSDGSRVSHVFDAADRRTALADATGRTTFAFDIANRNTRVVDPAGKTLTYSFDAAGQRARLLDPDGGRFTYAYTAAGQLRRLVNPQGETTTQAYDVIGRLSVRRLASGARSSFAYDLANQPLRIAHVTSASVTLAKFDYRYDPVGNRTRVVESATDVVTWSYDATYQLTRERRSGATSFDVTYAYDPAGNRLLRVEGASRTTSAYDAASQILYANAGATRTTFAFDGAGNMRRRMAGAAVVTYSWDPENQLTRIQTGAAALVTNAYSGDFQRRSRDDASGPTKFVWDRQNLLVETDGAGATQAEYTQTAETFGQLVSQRRGAATSAGLFDAIGSTAKLIDPSQSATDSYVYGAFGDIRVQSGSTTNSHTYVGALGYYREGTSDLKYIRRRWQSSELGSFVSSDPVLALNQRYVYALNRPTLIVDPSGKIGIFFEGTGMERDKPTEIQRIYALYDGEKHLFLNPDTFDSRGVLNETSDWEKAVDEAYAAVCRAVCKRVRIDCKTGKWTNEPPEDVDIFGYSRGAVEAIILAQKLNDEGCKCDKCLVVTDSKVCLRWRYGLLPHLVTEETWGAKWVVRILPVPIRFLGLIDPVNAGMGVGWVDRDGGKIPPNVRNLRLVVAGMTLSRVIFTRSPVDLENKQKTSAFKKTFKDFSHEKIHWERSVGDFLMKEARSCDVSFFTMEANKK